MEFINARGVSLIEKPSPNVEVLGRELGGFDFSNHFRNEKIVSTMPAGHMPRAMKTGTTICGAVFDGGIVLGADTRATEGTIVCDKNCEKIHYIAPNIYCCGAGTAADTENVTKLISSQLELMRLQTKTESRVVSAMTLLKRRLFQYQGHVSAALVLGGVDSTGSHLYTVYPHGSTDKLPFVSMGSGSLNAMAALESGYKDDMTEDEAVALVARAIRAGVLNDLGSGSNVDITVIRSPDYMESSGKEKVTILRGYEILNEASEVRNRIIRPQGRIIPKGATKVIKEVFHKHVEVTTISAPASAAQMDEDM